MTMPEDTPAVAALGEAARERLTKWFGPDVKVWWEWDEEDSGSRHKLVVETDVSSVRVARVALRMFRRKFWDAAIVAAGVPDAIVDVRGPESMHVRFKPEEKPPVPSPSVLTLTSCQIYAACVDAESDTEPEAKRAVAFALIVKLFGVEEAERTRDWYIDPWYSAPRLT